ncbi:MAG: oligosaccharide flippase family protein [Geminicoccaceae bacterium]
MNLARALTFNMALLTIGKVLTLVTSLATVAILTRMLGPDGFGLYRSVTAYVGLAVIVSNLGLYLIFVREFSKPDVDQSRMIGEGLSLRLLSAVGIIGAAALLSIILPYEPIVRWGILLSVPGAVALAAHQLLAGVFQEKLKQTGPVVAEVAGAAVSLGAVVLLVRLDLGIIPVLLAFVAGNLVTLTVSWIAAYRLVPFSLHVNVDTWRALMVPALPVAGASILQLSYFKTDAVVLSLLRPAEDVGFYGVARQVLDTFIGFAVMYTGLIMPLMSRHAKPGDPQFRDHLRNAFDTLAVGSVGCALLGLLWAQQLITLIGGEHFAKAAHALRAMAPLIVLYPLCMICRYAVTALDRQMALLKGYVLAAIMGIGTFFALVPSYGQTGAAIGLLVGESAVFVVAWHVLARDGQVQPRLRILLLSIVCAAAVATGVRAVDHLALPWLLQAAGAGLAYLVLLVAVGAIPPNLLSMILAPAVPESEELRARADRAADIVASGDIRRAVREVKVIDLLGAVDGNHVVSRLMQRDRWARLLDRYVGWSVQQILLYLAGCVLFSLGVKLFIDADFGVDPLHAMAIGIEQTIDHPLVGIGTVVSVVTLLLLGLWSLWNRRWPPLTTFVTMALVAYLVDLWNVVELERYTRAFLSPVPMLLLGLLFDAYACALVIMSGIGIRVMDLLAVSAVLRLGWPFMQGKLLLELLFVLAALALAGPLGVGTWAFLIVVAPVIQIAMWANGRYLRLPNYGLGQMPIGAG